jgi:hypothetical protein
MLALWREGREEEEEHTSSVVRHTKKCKREPEIYFVILKRNQLILRK